MVFRFKLLDTRIGCECYHFYSTHPPSLFNALMKLMKSNLATKDKKWLCYFRHHISMELEWWWIDQLTKSSCVWMLNLLKVDQGHKFYLEGSAFLKGGGLPQSTPPPGSSVIIPHKRPGYTLRWMAFEKCWLFRRNKKLPGALRFEFT